MARVIIIFSVVCLAAAVFAEQKSSLDAVDIDAVFKSERLLKNYIDCLLDKKPCSKEGSELKARIPKVLETNCDDCSQNEKERAIKVIKKLSSERPDLWTQVKAKYDPTGDYTKAFSEKYNIKGL